MGEATPGVSSDLVADGVWGDLLDRLAASIDDLVVDFLARLRDQGMYAGTPIDADDLDHAARATLDMLIRQLSGARLTDDDRDLPRHLGARRARQGVSRDALLEAVRLDYRVLWAGLTRIAGDEHATTLVAHADEVLTTVERYIGDVQVAFLDERDALARSSRLGEQRALARLLAAEPADVARVAAEVAPALRLRVDAPLEVLCLTSADDVEKARAAHPRRHTIEWDFAAGSVLIRERLAGAPIEAIDGVAAGLVDDVEGVALLPGAVRLSQRLAAIARRRGIPLREADAWPELVADALGDGLPALSAGRHITFAALEESERRRLLDTVRAYCATGSVKDTAERLFVHRNTVQNRLTTFAESTGLDVTVPEQAARALIAFARE